MASFAPAVSVRAMNAPGPGPSSGFLDRPVARLAALGVVALIGAALAWIHRDDLMPADPVAPAADDPVSRCLVQRAADIEQMRADGVIDEAQAKLFTERAAALCEAQAGQGSGPPPQ